ncbi:MAG: carboxypeptidase regulatory-like domain-containing protein, partial [Petrotogales bacterium]
MIVSFKSRSPAIEKLNVGSIHPYLHFYGENDNIEEYQMNPDPKSRNREWIISFKDDADLGEEAWIAYGEGEKGKANSIIFSSNKDILKSGTKERDGIQLKVAEKEYFDFLSAEIDYASINFGRNSFEKGYSHDLNIPEDFVVEFEAELFTSDFGGYTAVRKEAEIYQELVKHRHMPEDSVFEKEPKKYNLTVVTHLGGTRFSYPWLSNITNRFFPVMWVELYDNENLILSGVAKKSFFMRYKAYATFSDVVEGNYLLKVYWKLDNSTKFFNGAKTVVLDEHKKIHVFCTWERAIQLIFVDQHGQGVEGVHAVLLNKDGFIFDENTTNDVGVGILKAPFSIRAYTLRAFYKDFVIFDGELDKSLRKLDVKVDIELYDLTVEVRDGFGLPPGVEITPVLSYPDDNRTVKLIPEEHQLGKFFFEDIPSGSYILQITYANFIDQKVINLPDDGGFVSIDYTATFDLVIDLFDSRANPLLNEKIKFKIFRSGDKLLELDEKIFSLPPASYTIEVYNDGELVGIKEVELTSNRKIKLVTTLDSPLPTIIFASTSVFIGIIIVLTFIRTLSVTSLLKFLVIALIVIALIQPWWSLHGLSHYPRAERTAHIFINPQVMVESTSFDGVTTFDIAELPELFVDFLGKVIFVAYAACIIIALSFISSKLGKKQYSLLLNLLGIVMITVIISTFYVGTSKVCEASIGRVQGEGLLSASLEETVLMHSQWGFDSGFYLVIASAILAIIFFFIEIKDFVKQGR